MNSKKILILGGDERALYLGEALDREKYRVCYFGFNGMECYGRLAEAVNDVAVIILPLPVTRDRVSLNTPLFDSKIYLSDFCRLVKKDQFVFGGQIPGSLEEELAVKGVCCFDYFGSEESAILNAVPTAEGVAGILIEHLPVTVKDMRCGVSGYGRVGRAIGALLKNMGAEVTVFARNKKDIAAAEAAGLLARELSTLKKEAFAFHCFINTVPHTVIGREEMQNLPASCLLVEVASAPFGIDFQAAKEFALETVKAGSLPGKVAPKTAGEIICRSLLPILCEKGLMT